MTSIRVSPSRRQRRPDDLGPDRSAELGITTGDKSCWDRGYASDAVRVISEIALRQMDLHRVFLRVHEGNHRSIRCYEKAGFQREGKIRESVSKEGEYHDVHKMSIWRSEIEKNG